MRLAQYFERPFPKIKFQDPLWVYWYSHGCIRSSSAKLIFELQHLSFYELECTFNENYEIMKIMKSGVDSCRFT